jgi:hypothetical protein
VQGLWKHEALFDFGRGVRHGVDAGRAGGCVRVGGMLVMMVQMENAEIDNMRAYRDGDRTFRRLDLRYGGGTGLVDGLS